MRFPLINLVILSPKALDAAIKAAAEARAGQIAKVYAHNPRCLRAALAARLRVKEQHLFAPEASLENETRVIEAFADAMSAERQEAQP